MPGIQKEPCDKVFDVHFKLNILTPTPASYRMMPYRRKYVCLQSSRRVRIARGVAAEHLRTFQNQDFRKCSMTLKGFMVCTCTIYIYIHRDHSRIWCTAPTLGFTWSFRCKPYLDRGCYEYVGQHCNCSCCLLLLHHYCWSVLMLINTLLLLPSSWTYQCNCHWHHCICCAFTFRSSLRLSTCFRN